MKIQSLLTALATGLLFWSACDTPKEGCFDVEAVNFDPAIDVNCEDCTNKCVYPQLKLDVLQLYNGQVWRPDSVYFDQQGHPFYLRDIAFYLSDFQLLQSPDIYTVTDTLRTSAFASNSVADTVEQTITDDVVLARRTTLTYSVGEFRTSGIFQAIALRLGLTEPVNLTIPGKAPTGHVLSAQTDRLWTSQTEGYVWFQAVIQRDTAAGTPTDTIRIGAAELGAAGLSIEGGGPYEHQTGFHFLFTLQAEYSNLFQQIDIQSGSTASWKSQMADNLDDVFDLIP